jgi:hypothetical protein
VSSTGGRQNLDRLARFERLRFPKDAADKFRSSVMKRVTAAIAIALSAASFSPAEAQLGTNLQFRTPLNYRFSVQPRSHVFFYNRQRHRWHHRHRKQFLPVLAGPAVIYQNGDIGIPPEEEYTASVPVPVVQPVVYRIGETGGCGVQRVNVPGSRGRTNVNIWRC